MVIRPVDGSSSADESRATDPDSADPRLEHVVAFLCRGKNVGFAIGSLAKVQLRAEVKNIFLLRRFPQHEARHNGSARFSATRARPDAVHAVMPKNFTNSPCGGVMLVSIRMPTVPPSCIAVSRPRANRLCAARGCHACSESG